jgi:hypothetical protein
MKYWVITHTWKRPISPPFTPTPRRLAGTQVSLKLQFDANLSPKLVRRLGELFPGSAHVFDTGLARSTTDERIWEFAAAERFTIITADSDFLYFAQSRPAPP